MKKDAVLLTTDLPLPIFVRGKVRDSYDLGPNLLIVATDRISAFDVVLPAGIPRKGQVLNKLAAFWFEKTRDIVPNHLLETVEDVKKLDDYIPPGSRFPYPDYLAGRSMITRKLKRLPVECVVRGYLSGSAWAEYRERGTVSGVAMPGGLKESGELARPIFTPTTKADTGHDQPLNRVETERLVGPTFAREMERRSLAVYEFARELARQRGIIIADTKMEFGLDADRLVLIDELLTPDSSRFWDGSLYQPGQTQESYDKQPVRDWLVRSGWDREPPAPELPPDVVKATTIRYVHAYERLTGQKLA